VNSLYIIKDLIKPFKNKETKINLSYQIRNLIKPIKNKGANET